MMKKFLWVLVAVLPIAFASCGGDEPDGPGNGENTYNPTNSEPEKGVEGVWVSTDHSFWLYDQVLEITINNVYLYTVSELGSKKYKTYRCCPIKRAGWSSNPTGYCTFNFDGKSYGMYYERGVESILNIEYNYWSSYKNTYTSHKVQYTRGNDSQVPTSKE